MPVCWDHTVSRRTAGVQDDDGAPWTQGVKGSERRKDGEMLQLCRVRTLLIHSRSATQREILW